MAVHLAGLIDGPEAEVGSAAQEVHSAAVGGELCARCVGTIGDDAGFEDLRFRLRLRNRGSGNNRDKENESKETIHMGFSKVNKGVWLRQRRWEAAAALAVISDSTM